MAFPPLDDGRSEAVPEDELAQAGDNATNSSESRRQREPLMGGASERVESFIPHWSRLGGDRLREGHMKRNGKARHARSRLPRATASRAEQSMPLVVRARQSAAPAAVSLNESIDEPFV